MSSLNVLYICHCHIWRDKLIRDQYFRMLYVHLVTRDWWAIASSISLHGSYCVEILEKSCFVRFCMKSGSESPSKIWKVSYPWSNVSLVTLETNRKMKMYFYFLGDWGGDKWYDWAIGLWWIIGDYRMLSSHSIFKWRVPIFQTAASHESAICSCRTVTDTVYVRCVVLCGCVSFIHSFSKPFDPH